MKADYLPPPPSSRPDPQAVELQTLAEQALERARALCGEASGVQQAIHHASAAIRYMHRLTKRQKVAASRQRLLELSQEFAQRATARTEPNDPQG